MHTRRDRPDDFPALYAVVRYMREHRGIGAYYCDADEFDAVEEDMLRWLESRGEIPVPLDRQSVPVDHFLVHGIPIVLR